MSEEFESPFVKWSTNDLQNEIDRREDEEDEDMKAAVGHLTQEIVDNFAPTHDMEDCNDTNTANGIANSYEEYQHDFDCNRCVFIELLKGEFTYADIPPSNKLRLVMENTVEDDEDEENEVSFLDEEADDDCD